MEYPNWSLLDSLESRLEELSNKCSWAFIVSRKWKLWSFLSTGLFCTALVRSALLSTGPFCTVLFQSLRSRSPPSSCVYLSTTKVEHLGSIIFSLTLIELSQSSVFTSCCSFLARLRVIAPSMAWAGAGVVGVEVGVELEGACLVGMSSSYT